MNKYEKSKLNQWRNEFWQSLPTGDIDGFELLKLIKERLQNFDVMIDGLVSQNETS